MMRTTCTDSASRPRNNPSDLTGSASLLAELWAPVSVIVLALLIACCGVARGASSAPAERPRRPNVVLIMTDDQGYGDLACHGNPVLATPHLDELWRQSLRLTNFHTDPTCSPTRAALMTGRYSTRTGVWHTVMGRHMPRGDELMMPQVFAAGGYRTAMFGKWHLGDNYPFRPCDRGFQCTLIHGGGGVGQIPDYWGNDYFDDTFFQHDSLRASDDRPKNDSNNLPDNRSGTTTRAQSDPRPFSGFCTDVFFRAAIEFIRSNRDQPFFVYVSTNAPHGPYRAPQQYVQQYADKVEGDAELAHFYGMIQNIDGNVGRLRGELQQLGLSDDTLLIFMTDNGTARGATFSDYRGNDGHLQSGFNAGMRGRKGSPYEGGHRVPCFIHWPTGGLGSKAGEAGAPAGRDIDRLASHIDLLPTLVGLCGLQTEHRFDGTNLAPLLLGQQTGWPERTLLVHHQELPEPEKHRFGCVMQDHWRLIVRNDRQVQPDWQLFDLRTDPGQTQDVGRLHPERVRRLRSAYEMWWKDISPRFAEYSRIVIGGPQNPTRLTCFEWHSSRRWWQRNVKAGFRDNGFWALDVARTGRYEFALRRWPAETGAAISAALDAGESITAVRARLRIGEVDVTQNISQGADAVRFQVTLPAGPTRLQTWFLEPDGQSRGAYYASVRYVEESK